MAKNKQVTSSSELSPEEQGGSFGVGLFMGVVAGSLGMFLFGTPQGRELLENLKRELEENMDNPDLPARAQRLIAEVRERFENQNESVNSVEEFPKFKRKLVE